MANRQSKSANNHNINWLRSQLDDRGFDMDTTDLEATLGDLGINPHGDLGDIIDRVVNHLTNNERRAARDSQQLAAAKSAEPGNAPAPTTQHHQMSSHAEHLQEAFDDRQKASEVGLQSRLTAGAIEGEAEGRLIAKVRAASSIRAESDVIRRMTHAAVNDAVAFADYLNGVSVEDILAAVGNDPSAPLALGEEMQKLASAVEQARILPSRSPR